MDGFWLRELLQLIFRIRGRPPCRSADRSLRSANTHQCGLGGRHGDTVIERSEQSMLGWGQCAHHPRQSEKQIAHARVSLCRTHAVHRHKLRGMVEWLTQHWDGAWHAPPARRCLTILASGTFSIRITSCSAPRIFGLT